MKSREGRARKEHGLFAWRMAPSLLFYSSLSSTHNFVPSLPTISSQPVRWRQSKVDSNEAIDQKLTITSWQEGLAAPIMPGGVGWVGSRVSQLVRYTHGIRNSCGFCLLEEKKSLAKSSSVHGLVGDAQTLATHTVITFSPQSKFPTSHLCNTRQSVAFPTAELPHIPHPWSVHTYNEIGSHLLLAIFCLTLSRDSANVCHPGRGGPALGFISMEALGSIL